MKNIYFLLLIVIIGKCEETYAQSGWIGLMPMEFNPSFAGNSGGHRIAALTSYEHSVKRSRETSPLNSTLASASYDNFISNIGSGVGFYMSSRKYSSGDTSSPYHISYTSFNALKGALIISPKISIRGKYTIAPSLGLNYKHLSYDFQAPGGNVNYDSSKIKFENFKSEIFYLSMGLLFNTEKFYIGYSHFFQAFNGARNMNSFYEEDYRSGKQYGIIQVGYKFQKNKDSKSSYTLQKVVWTNRKFDLITIVIDGLTFTYKYKKILAGISTGSSSHFGIGYQSNKLKIFYSQNLDLSNFYHGELSCRLLIPNKKKTFYQF
ncbi:MAG: hypothetical protein J7604_21275 [Sporocytophaga sp.]|uniref:hypothetical protein n=1 Tax=Sporocytophaga sp. TaxID=2231183 RepID=UPI001B195651|nr:hypothetical protein [Sporocytophaga sp.]MBO9702758.1 hypothetical protein [Sporocytophaga sp.]